MYVFQKLDFKLLDCERIIFMAVIFYAIIVAQIYLERKKVRDKKFKRQIIFTYKKYIQITYTNCISHIQI